MTESRNNLMNKEIRKLVLYAALWIFCQILAYYWISTLFFIGILLTLGFLLVVLIIPIYQIIRLIIERKNLKKTRTVKVCFWCVIFCLTYFVPVSSIIEKADWYILYPKRMEIVEKVQKGELRPNVSWNDYLCELPFQFPIVSKDGNDIKIRINDRTQAITVEFFVHRGTSISPSTYFIYTNDDERIKYYEESIRKKSRRNWKIKKNWYRINE